MEIIILIVVFLGLAFLIFKIIQSIINASDLKKYFSNGNVIVFGAKGKGKDLIFQKVINIRKKEYFSNINYGTKRKKKYNKFSFDLIDLSPNTFENLIDNQYFKIDNKLNENQDIYISDAGIYLPSQYDYLLNKKYKSFGLAYALSRHLWNNNIHVNSQALGRIWKLLREQADVYIKVRRTIKLPFILITCYTVYDKYSSAENDLRPVRTRFNNKYSKAEFDIYNSSNGLIKNAFIIQFKRSVKYNTRIFKNLLLK